MKKVVAALIVLVIAGAGVFAYFYFKGSDKHLQLIPKNAMIVGTIDIKSLAEKSDYKKIADLTYFKDMQKKSKDANNADPHTKGLMDVLSNPLTSGVNVFSDIYVFAANFNTGITGGLIFDIKDPAAFEQSVLKVYPEAQIKKNQTYNWVGQDGIALAWSKTGGIVAGAYDKSGSALLETFLDATFKRTKEESILANPEFKKFSQNHKDISYFMNMGEFYTAMANFSPSGNQDLYNNFKDKYKDVYSWSSIDFQQNRVLATSHIDMDPETAKKNSMMAPTGISDEHLKNITDKNCYMLFTGNIDATKLFNLINGVPKLKEAMDQMAPMTGMSTQELEDIFGGEISFALVDFKKPDMSSLPPVSPDDFYGQIIRDRMAKVSLPVFTVNFSSKNKDGLKKLLETDAAKIVMPVTPDGYYKYSVYSGLYNIDIAPNKYGYTITSSDAFAKTIASGSNLGTLPSVAGDLAKNNSSSGYVNLNWSSYPQDLRDYTLDNIGNKPYQAFSTYMSMFKDVTAKGSSTDGEVSINLTPGQGNSLYRFFAQADEAYKVVKD